MGGDGWAKLPFGHCATLVRDTVHPSKVRGQPYIGLEHINEGQLSLSGYGSADQVASIKVRFKKGDILFGKLRPYFRKVVIAPFDGVCSTDIWVVRKKNGVDQKYLFYWMASHEFIEEATRASEGTRMPRAQWEYVGRITKAVPPLKEQQAIACILGALDEKIELNRKMNKTLEEMARAIFKSWFVDFDPVRAKASVRRAHPDWTDEQISRAACAHLKPEIAGLFPDSFEDSELGEIPKGWRASKLGAEVSTVLGGTPSRAEPAYWGGDVPWINSGKANEFRVIEPSEFITRAGLESSATKVLPERTTIIAITGATLGQISLAEISTCANQSVVGVLGTDLLPSEFIYFWTKEHVDDLLAWQTGGAQQHINKNNVNDLPVLCPSKTAISAFITAARPVFDRIKACCTESHTLAALRDTLLPKLISGELRVPDAERIVGRMA